MIAKHCSSLRKRTDSKSVATKDTFVHPNYEFRNWLQDRFSVTPPETALDIVQHPAEIGEQDSLDPFCRWLQTQAGDDKDPVEPAWPGTS